MSKTHRTPLAAIWTGAILAVLFVWGTSSISIAGSSAYAIVVSCTVIVIFLSFKVPIALGLLAHGMPKWNRMGPWDLGLGLFKLFAVLSMCLVFYVGI